MKIKYHLIICLFWSFVCRPLISLKTIRSQTASLYFSKEVESMYSILNNIFWVTEREIYLKIAQIFISTCPPDEHDSLECIPSTRNIKSFVIMEIKSCLLKLSSHHKSCDKWWVISLEHLDNLWLLIFRLTLVLSCAMNFKNYPHDTQVCNLKIESSKYRLFSANVDIC